MVARSFRRYTGARSPTGLPRTAMGLARRGKTRSGRAGLRADLSPRLSEAALRRAGAGFQCSRSAPDSPIPVTMAVRKVACRPLNRRWGRHLINGRFPCPTAVGVFAESGRLRFV
jgi:hypothetical protein